MRTLMHCVCPGHEPREAFKMSKFKTVRAKVFDHLPEQAPVVGTDHASHVQAAAASHATPVADAVAAA